MDTKEFKAQVEKIKALEAEVESLKLVNKSLQKNVDLHMQDHARAEDRLNTRIAKLRHILHSTIESI